MMTLLIQRPFVRQRTAFGRADSAGVQDHGVLFIDGEPILHPIAEGVEQHAGVSDKASMVARLDQPPCCSST